MLDLTKYLPIWKRRKYDVVFNHTTLEHIYDVKRAFKNLCKLSKDIVIIVVPFAQVQHEEKDAFDDYWRITPTCLRKMFEENGFQTIYENANNDFNSAVYLFFVASRMPDKWRDKFPEYCKIQSAGEWIGRDE